MKKIANLFLTLLFVFCLLLALPLNASAASTETQDGLEVTITTDKSEYTADEDIQVTVKIKNNNSYKVKNISIETLLPEGLSLKTGNHLATDINIEGGASYYGSVVACLSEDLKNNVEIELGDTSKTQQDTPTPDGSDQETNSPRSDHNPYVIACVVLLILLVAAFCIFFAFKSKKTTRMMSLLLCIAMVLTMLPTSAFAAITKKETVISVTREISIGNHAYTIQCNVLASVKSANSTSGPISYNIYLPNPESIVSDAETNISYVNNMIIIVFSRDATETDINDVIRSVDGKVIGYISSINQYQIKIAPHSLDELNTIVETIQENDCVLFAHYDRAYKNIECAIAPNDPWDGDVDNEDWSDADVDGSNWWLETIEATAAWEYNDKFSNIKIGVVDNGFDTGHEDLNITFPEEFKLLNSKEDHGTHVAGIIGATPNNEKGISGIVWKSELICFDWQPTKWQKWTTGWKTDTMIYAGLISTVESGAKVVNFSLGASGNFPEGKIFDQNAIDEQGRTASGYMAVLLKDYDFIVVQSAGNGGVNAENNALFASIQASNCVSWGTGRASVQGIMNRVLIVAAVEQFGTAYRVSSFSCGGSQVNIAAPGGNNSGNNGEDIYSTVTGGWSGKYKALAGTSMAAPIVTGIASLVWSINNNFTGDEVVDIVCNNTALVAQDNPNSPLTSGDYPIVNAKLAVEEAIRRTGTGTLSGKICKASDRITAIPDASIEVYQNGDLYTSCTSNSTGNYTIDLPAGQYFVKITSEGYIDFQSYATVTASENTYMETFLLIQGSEAESGIANGKVINSLTGASTSGVTLTVKKNWNNSDETSEIIQTTTTDENGYYSLELPLGNYTVIATKDGYTSSSFNIIVQEGTTSNQNGTITPIVAEGEGNRYLITLTWGENPNDLDSHVEGILSSGSAFHVYYGYKSQYDGDTEICNLDYDDISSYGPEHITLTTTTDSPYYYYIHRYSGSGAIITSEAQITVEQGNTLIAKFNVPTDLSSDDYWNVFAIKNGELIINNSITTSPDTSYAN